MVKSNKRKLKLSVLIFLIMILMVIVVLCCGSIGFTRSDGQAMSQKVVVEAKSDFTLPHVAAYYYLPFSNKPLLKIYEKQANEITADSPIGIHTIGYDCLFHHQELTVEVVDTTPPVIELVDDETYFIKESDIYVEEGYSAYDNYDGDISDKVAVSDIVDGIKTYSVSDSSGNTTTVERRIKYVDEVAPTISVSKGYVIVRVGSSYSVPSASANDDRDGDISSKITVSNNVNTSKIGAYSITYSVKDRAGNQASASVPVYVFDAQSSNISEATASKKIYLTFDDGPSGNTSRLLDILDKYNVKATFFVTGKSANRDCIGDAYRRGHSIGIHCYEHNYSLIYTSQSAFFNDFYKIDDVIYQQTGMHTKINRFPGGTSNTVSRNYCRGIMSALANEVVSRGYRYFDWNVSSGDAGETSSTDQVFYNVTYGCSRRNTSVVLQHDTQGFSVDAVESIIAWGIANGYTFLPISDNTVSVRHGANN